MRIRIDLKCWIRTEPMRIHTNNFKIQKNEEKIFYLVFNNGKPIEKYQKAKKKIYIQ
jgi:hypothetical protein